MQTEYVNAVRLLLQVLPSVFESGREAAFQKSLGANLAISSNYPGSGGHGFQAHRSAGM